MLKRLHYHYQQLLREYGDPVKYWPQWCSQDKSVADREKIVIGMVLVQRTSWHNADIALKNLKKAGLLSINRITKLKTLAKLTQLIRPAGFYQSKPGRLKDLCAFIVAIGGIAELIRKEASEIRPDLLSLKGVGQETADTVLLYALDKPVFVIDEYTRRWVTKNGLTSEKDYVRLQDYFESNLPPDKDVYQKFHALIIISQRGRDKSVMEIV